MATAVARPGPQLQPAEARLLQGRAVGEPLEEVDDPAQVRATRAARRDPLHAPDEPLALWARPFDAPASPWAAPPAPGEPDGSVRLIVQRELTTVAEARLALGAALGVPAAELTLVLRGAALRRDDALVWDEGAHAQRLLYWRRTPGADTTQSQV